jgi:uncharacterized membrane protein
MNNTSKSMSDTGDNTRVDVATAAAPAIASTVSRWHSLTLLLVSLALVVLMAWQWFDSRARIEDLRQRYTVAR